MLMAQYAFRINGYFGYKDGRFMRSQIVRNNGNFKTDRCLFYLTLVNPRCVNDKQVKLDHSVFCPLHYIFACRPIATEHLDRLNDRTKWIRLVSKACGII